MSYQRTKQFYRKGYRMFSSLSWKISLSYLRIYKHGRISALPSYLWSENFDNVFSYPRFLFLRIVYKRMSKILHVFLFIIFLLDVKRRKYTANIYSIKIICMLWIPNIRRLWKIDFVCIRSKKKMSIVIFFLFDNFDGSTHTWRFIMRHQIDDFSHQCLDCE